MSHPYDLLGLDENADARAVKRAYAALLRRHRPDADPDAFQALHEAYRIALAWLREDDGPDRSDAAAWHVAMAPVAHEARVHDAEASDAEAYDTDAFDADAFLAGCFEAAFDHDPERIARWLQTQRVLWSLRRKPAIGAWLLRAMATDAPPMSVRSFDRIAAFFGFHDPVERHSMQRLHALRERLGDDWNARCVSLLPTVHSLWPVPVSWPPSAQPQDRGA